jgi:aminoglycoside phosphotransferase (APT) family kinase protein
VKPENPEDMSALQPRILDYLQSRLPQATRLSLQQVQRMSVGWSHETCLFDLHYREAGDARRLGLCLRRDPGNALLRHLSDLEQQFRVLQCLQRTALPAPKPYWFERDPTILGAPFLIMEKVSGTCPNPWGRDGRAFYKAAADRGVLPRSFTTTLATLHTLDWRAAGLEFLGVPTSGSEFVQREIAKWRELIALSDHPPEPVLTDLICWLEGNIPASDRLSLVHGAYRTGNVNREATPLLSNLVERDAFFRDYQALTGFVIDEAACRYYNALYAMRSVAFWMSASGLYASGRSNDIRLARTAWSVPVVLERAARDLGY